MDLMTETPRAVLTPGQIPTSALDAPFYVAERNVVLLPTTPEWSALVPPKTPVLTLKDRRCFAVRNTPPVNLLLHNQGWAVPSPLLASNYDWAGQTPYITQRDTAAMLVCRPRAYVLNEMGTGKTFATLAAIDWLLQEGICRRALIVAPLSTLQVVWEAEVAQRLPYLRTAIIHGTKKQRLKALDRTDYDVAIINHDGVKVILPELVAQQFDIIVIDELAVLRNHRSALWTHTKKLVHAAPYVWGLTGSPTPNGPEDAYAQVKLLTPERVPMSYTKFRQKVCLEVNQGIFIPRAEAKNIVYGVMQPSVRFTRAQVVELPECYHVERLTPMSDDQTKMYEALRKHCIAQHAAGQVKAANAAVLVGKLLQASAGAVYTEKRGVIDLQPHERIAITQEYIDEAAGKVIVFVPYIHLCQMLASKINQHNPGSLAVVNGNVSTAERLRLFQDFQDPNSPLRVLIAHPACMAHGITLTAANTIIWYAPYTSNEKTEQANARITRPGQTREQMIITLYANSTERKVYQTLKRNGDLQATILAMFAEDFL